MNDWPRAQYMIVNWSYDENCPCYVMFRLNAFAESVPYLTIEEWNMVREMCEERNSKRE